MRRVYVILLCLLAINVTTIEARSLKRVAPYKVGMSRERLKNVDRAIEQSIAAGEIPGAVVAVVRGNTMPYIKAYGNRSLAPVVEPMSENTIFDIASCTKPMVTAISAMILVEQGRLSLRDDLDRYIPNFNANRDCDTICHSIRIRHLMTHSSGLNPYVLVDDLKSKYDTISREVLIDHIRTTKRRYEPGTSFNYSCLNFILLQYIIEDITGESLRSFANRNIFAPLGMKESDYHGVGESISDKIMSRIAPTEVISADSVIRGFVHDDLAREVGLGVSGNSGIFSTASDMAILAAALLGDGSVNGRRVLSPLTVTSMRSVPPDMSDLGRAIGWDVYSPYASNRGDLLSAAAYGHTGFTGTSITIDPENDIAVILLTNIVHLDDYKMQHILRLRGVVANAVAGDVMGDYEP